MKLLKNTLLAFPASLICSLCLIFLPNLAASANSDVKDEAKEPKLLVELPIIPKTFSVSIYRHELPGKSGAKRRAWSYVSHGFAALGQPEMVLTVPAREGERDGDAPREPVKVLSFIYGAGEAEEEFTDGDYFTFPADFKPVAGQFKTCLFLLPQGDVNLPSAGKSKQMLAIVPVTEAEFETYKLLGPGRVCRALALESGYFPFPTFCYRD